jgi:membrane protein DedA with SNARE-associated domain
MTDPLESLARNGYVVLFLSVFAEQLGIPLPSAPVVLAAGALAGSGRMGLVEALALILVAALLADSLWYALGRRYGARVLGFLCRVSLEPDSCVRRTQEGFARNGPWLIITSKFVPGLNTVTPPLAGVVGIGIARFLLLDALGTLAQSVILLGAGYSLKGPFGRLARWLAEAGGSAGLILVGVFLAYVGLKYARRHLFLRRLRVARIVPADLKARLDAGEPVFIVDLRQQAGPQVEVPALPGALRLQPHELEARHAEIPRDREVVLYCT